jgi:hypothetical protein
MPDGRFTEPPSQLLRARTAVSRDVGTGREFLEGATNDDAAGAGAPAASVRAWS